MDIMEDLNDSIWQKMPSPNNAVAEGLFNISLN